MKRSVTVPLLLMGTAALTSCGEKVESDVYVDADSCIASSRYDSDKCVADYAVAVKDHDVNARAFSSRGACQAEFGIDQCEPTTAAHASGGLFVPKLSGYLMAARTREGESIPSRALYHEFNQASFRDETGMFISSKTGPVELKVSDLEHDQSAAGSSGGGYGSGGGNGDFSSGIARGGFGFGGDGGGGHGGGGE
jgi:uncharacterized protein YgiB involved in biofilm formation